MSTKRKLLLSSAGAAAGGAPLDITDVFSTFLFEGTGSAQTITNGIDLDGEGGLVWIKNRENQYQDHSLFDTTRLPSHVLYSNTTSGSTLSSSRFSSFNSDGFTVGTDTSTNESGKGIVSWTWRKAENWFDIVTWTGDGTSPRNISHSLGSEVGMIIVKRTSSSEDWTVYHRSSGATKYFTLNSTNAEATFSQVWADTEPTSTQFTVGNTARVNTSGQTYVAYLFAHNDGDGDFGPDADQDIIKCGSYTGGSGNTEIDLGFEPQWLMIKRTDSAEDWLMLDVMRGLIVSGDDVASTGQKDIMANLSLAEVTPSYAGVSPQPNGFKVRSGLDGIYSSNGGTYIYIAIRRGPLAEPTSATDVFAIDDRSGGPPNAVSGFPVDMGLFTNIASSDNKYVGARLIQGKRLYANLSSAEGSSSELAFDYQNGFINRSDTSTDNIHFMWRRAPSYFDCVCYSGTTTSPSFPPQTLNHNLGVVPEMMWVKSRSTGGSSTYDWQVYHKDVGNTKALFLNETSAPSTGAAYWNNTTPTATQFTVGGGYGVNQSGQTYIAFLFSSVAGISKVGSFSHTNGGGDTNVDCGFSSSARFVIYKRTDSSGSWYQFDTFRGIVSGSGDAQLELNSTNAENTSFDLIDPYSSGFKIPSNAIATGDYIFYAIAA